LLDPTKDPIIRGVVEEIAADTEEFIKFIFPPDETEQYEKPMSPMHREMLELLDGPEQRVCILAPRGIGKTSLFEAFALRKIIYRDTKFLMYVSASQTHAETQTENIKATLSTNANIRRLFGSPKVGDAEEDIRDSFSRRAWTAYGDCLVVPRGSGQQVRGSRWRGGVRPDLIIIDDLEDDETVMSEDQRAKRKSWFFGALLKCVSPYKNSKIVYVDTLKHEDALPTYLEHLEGWTFRRYSACDENMKTLIPEFWSQEKIDRDYKDHQAAGTLDEFYREMLNIPVSPQTASFRTSYFKYYEEAELSGPDADRLETVVIIDPAKTLTPQSDFSAVVGVSVNQRLASVYVRDIVNARLYPDDLYGEIVSMLMRLKCRTVGLEVTSLNEFVLYPFKQYLAKRRLFDVEIIELKPRQKKEDRIKALIPLYRMGMIYHNKACCAPLEQQLVSYPRAKHDDVSDAMAYSVELFELSGKYLLEEWKRGDLPEPANVWNEEPIDLEEHQWELCGGIFG